MIWKRVPKYSKVCEYEKEFKDKKHQDDLYSNVYKKLRSKSNYDRQEIKTLTKVSLSGVERSNIISIIVPAFIFYLTIMKGLYDELKIDSTILAFFIIIFIISLISFMINNIYYFRYYTFLLSVIENIEVDKKKTYKSFYK